MARVEQAEGSRGSLRSIQRYVNHAAEALDTEISRCSGGKVAGPVEWRSPLSADGFAEYSDRDFLDLLELKLLNRSLEDFWPKRGPQWDALGRSSNGQIVLVEAKAHIGEIVSPPSAAGEASLQRIRSSLEEVAAAMGAESTCDWTGTFYQYANRLAHLYLLRELNEIPAWLVLVCFTNDREMGGPATSDEWDAAMQVLKGALGLRKHRLSRYVLEVFLDASEVPGAGAYSGAATVR